MGEYYDSSWNEHARDPVMYPYHASVSIERGVLVTSGVSEASTAKDAVRFACADALARWKGLLVMRGRKGAARPTGPVSIIGRVRSDAPTKRAGKPTRTISCTLTLPETGSTTLPITTSFTPDLVKPLYDLALEVR